MGKKMILESLVVARRTLPYNSMCQKCYRKWIDLKAPQEIIDEWGEKIITLNKKKNAEEDNECISYSESGPIKYWVGDTKYDAERFS